MAPGTSHPTIKTPEQGLSVLSRFAADFQRPAAHEGYHRIIYVKPSDHTAPVYTQSEVAAILQRVRDSQPVTTFTAASQYVPHSGRYSHSPRGYTPRRGSRGSRGGAGSPYPPRGRGQSSSGWNNSRGWQTVGIRGNSNIGHLGSSPTHNTLHVGVTEGRGPPTTEAVTDPHPTALPDNTQGWRGTNDVHNPFTID